MGGEIAGIVGHHAAAGGKRPLRIVTTGGRVRGQGRDRWGMGGLTDGWVGKR
ncbi:hypothetical protein [Dictyobacter alpinus]|nr:hypothetical protein [Dictyobacter alpinus]